MILYYPELVNLKKDDGYTPLHMAAVNNHLDLTALLASHVWHCATIIIHSPFSGLYIYIYIYGGFRQKFLLRELGVTQWAELIVLCFVLLLEWCPP